MSLHVWTTLHQGGTLVGKVHTTQCHVRLNAAPVPCTRKDLSPAVGKTRAGPFRGPKPRSISSRQRRVSRVPATPSCSEQVLWRPAVGCSLVRQFHIDQSRRTERNGTAEARVTQRYRRLFSQQARSFFPKVSSCIFTSGLSSYQPSDLELKPHLLCTQGGPNDWGGNPLQIFLRCLSVRSL